MQRFVLITGLLASMTCLPSSAQTMNLKADVPFAFQVGNVQMPAGHYQINHNGPVLTVRTSAGRNAAQSLTAPLLRGSRVNAGVLVFNRYGNQYFLTAVVPPNEGAGRSLPTGRHEKELIARSSTGETVTAALRRN
jgi:hypothetical protein